MADDVDPGRVAFTLVTQMLTVMVERDPAGFAAILGTCQELEKRAADAGEDVTEHRFVLDVLRRIGS